MANIRNRPEDELGPESAGQSGDNQQLSDVPDASSESIEELAEEGNAFEAEFVSGVENAKRPDEGEVRTHEKPKSELPREYLTDEELPNIDDEAA